MRTFPCGSCRSSPPRRTCDFFAALFGENAFVDPRVFTHRSGQRTQSVAATQPWGLLGLGLVLVLLLAANERLNSRLTVGPAA